MKPAFKYGIIGFIIAAFLFLMIPGGDNNVTANMVNAPSGTEQVETNNNEPVIEVENTVDWSEVTIKQQTDTLEYSKETVDPLSLVSSDDSDVVITTDDNIELTSVGEQSVIYTLSKEGQTKDVELTFNVTDTKKPKISIENEEITIDAGDSFDPLNNVTAVKDAVDGKLSYTESQEPDRGEYTVTGYYDTNTKGTYEITVTAKDSNGNKRTKTYKLTVNEPVAVAAAVTGTPDYYEEEPVDEGADYICNTNTYKFHYPWCGSVNQMKDSNKWYVHMTRDEIIAMGYVPCKNCNP